MMYEMDRALSRCPVCDSPLELDEERGYACPRCGWDESTELEEDEMWIVPSTDLRRRVREVLDRVRVQRQPVVVYTYDAPQAVLIPYDEYEDYQSWRSRQQQRRAWLAELRAIAQEVSERGALTDDEAAALVDEARAA